MREETDRRLEKWRKERTWERIRKKKEGRERTEGVDIKKKGVNDKFERYWWRKRKKGGKEYEKKGLKGRSNWLESNGG